MAGFKKSDKDGMFGGKSWIDLNDREQAYVIAWYRDNGITESVRSKLPQLEQWEAENGKLNLNNVYPKNIFTINPYKPREWVS